MSKVQMEILAEAVHQAYCQYYLKNKGKEYWTKGDYSLLDEETKQIDRETVIAVLNAQESNSICDAMTFGHAVEAMKQGKKVARAGWNGKGMFLYYVPENEYPASTEIATKYYEGGMVPYGAYIAMKTADENVVPWLASQTDMLSSDWQIVE